MQAVHLGYHYVGDEAVAGLNCPVARLIQQIEFLQAAGYEIMTCREVAKRLRTNQSLPEKHATLSFDDGLRSQFENAFPILHKRGVPATFFYITCALDHLLPPVIGFQILIGLLGAQRLEKEILPKLLHGTVYHDILDPTRYDLRERYGNEAAEVRRIKLIFNHFLPPGLKREKLDRMFEEYVGSDSQLRYAQERFISLPELQQMAAAGMEIASHTVNHPSIASSALTEVNFELTESQRRLTEVLGCTKVETLAWPFGGKFSPAVLDLARAHYNSAWNFLASETKIPPSPYGDWMDLPRLGEQTLIQEE